MLIKASSAYMTDNVMVHSKKPTLLLQSGRLLMRVHIVEENSKLILNVLIVKKAFQVTGHSSALGNADTLIHRASL